MDSIGRTPLPHNPPWAIRSEDAIFFVTICAKERAGGPLILDRIPARLIDSIAFNNAQGRWHVFTAVVMPDHIHMLVRAPVELQRVVNDWKHWTSRHLSVRWQRDFFDHRLRNDESLREKADYMLQNPVRAELVTIWEDWPHRFQSVEMIQVSR